MRKIVIFVLMLLLTGTVEAAPSEKIGSEETIWTAFVVGNPIFAEERGKLQVYYGRGNSEFLAEITARERCEKAAYVCRLIGRLTTTKKCLFVTATVAKNGKLGWMLSISPMRLEAKCKKRFGVTLCAKPVGYCK